jgi:hypothetical protein
MQRLAMLRVVMLNVAMLTTLMLIFDTLNVTAMRVIMPSEIVKL